MMASSNQHHTWGCVKKKKASTASDDPMNQVAQEKCIREEKKKKPQKEKWAEEKCFEAGREKTITQAIVVTTKISSPLTPIAMEQMITPTWT
jgi:hypothetical protein